MRRKKVLTEKFTSQIWALWQNCFQNFVTNPSERMEFWSEARNLNQFGVTASQPRKMPKSSFHSQLKVHWVMNNWSCKFPFPLPLFWSQVTNETIFLFLVYSFCFSFRRVRVEYYVNENTFKERLQLYFIKNQRSSKYSHEIFTSSKWKRNRRVVFSSFVVLARSNTNRSCCDDVLLFSWR
jgi:hypothetical protein